MGFEKETEDEPSRNITLSSPEPARLRVDRVMYAIDLFILSAPDGPTATRQVALELGELIHTEYEVWCACWDAYRAPHQWVPVERGDERDRNGEEENDDGGPRTG